MNPLEESSEYAKRNPSRRKPKIYSHELLDAVNWRIPNSILEAMNKIGWNALGIYEVVAEEIKKEKKRKKDG